MMDFLTDPDQGQCDGVCQRNHVLQGLHRLICLDALLLLEGPFDPHLHVN